MPLGKGCKKMKMRWNKSLPSSPLMDEISSLRSSSVSSEQTAAIKTHAGGRLVPKGKDAILKRPERHPQSE
ncbi:MAG: hypothetical protein AB7P17_03100, partial [Nitrospirales bacterium]